MTNDVRSSYKLSRELLVRFYSISENGSQRITPMAWSAASESLGMSDSDRNVALRRLKDEGLIEFKPASEAIGFTSMGLEIAEQELMKENRVRREDDPFPATRAGVLEELEYWAQRQHDGQPGSNYWQAVESRLVHLRHLDQRMMVEEKAEAPSHQGLLVFISHSSQDAVLAEALIDLLKAATGLTANQIRCSSVDGYRLPVGVNSEATLRAEVNAAGVAVGLITPNSLFSYFVMFELGARWGAELFLAPLLAGVEARELKAPLSLLNALSAHSESQLYQLVENIAQRLNKTLQSGSAYSRHVAAVKNLASATSRRQDESLTAEDEQFREQLKFRKSLQRIASHTFIEGDDEEICSRCAEVDCKAVHLLDMNIDGRGKKATCPQCKSARAGMGWPIRRAQAEETARRIAKENDKLGG
jgi:TIR domain